MHVLTDTLRQIELSVQMVGAVRYLLPLRRGIVKAFADGHDAHRSNVNIKPIQKKKLSNCERCSQIKTIMGSGPLCIDNDAWKLLGDRCDFGEIKPSVDLLLFVVDSDMEQLVMVEAKLGGAVRRKGDAPQRPSQVEICEKYDWSVKRIGGCLKVNRTLWLLVSSNTLQKMRLKVSRWNRSDSTHPIRCVCCADFLAKFEVEEFDQSKIDDCNEQGSLR